jgi:SAM-dependent methyltransferase
MDRHYWEQLTLRYEDEVFSVAAYDKQKRVESWLGKLSNGSCDVLDLGCGVGSWLPLLGRLFRSVTAVDISAGLLRRAKSAHGGLGNVRFVRADVTRDVSGVPKADVVLCVNAILTPSLTKRRAMFHAAVDRLRVRGHLLLVVPALESALLTKRRLIDWNVEDGMMAGAAVREALRSERTSALGWLRGVVPVTGVSTKHYLREELEAVLKSFGLRVRAIEKLEYPWETEFAEPPAWMREPYPWDWLVVAKKTAVRQRSSKGK